MKRNKGTLMMKYVGRLLSMVLLIGAVACDDGLNEPPEGGVDIDLFDGEHRTIEIPEGLHRFTPKPFVCYMKASGGSIIKREGEIIYSGEVPTIYMQRGLKDGIYQLLYLEYDNERPEADRYAKAHFGLGCMVKIEGGKSTVMSSYNSSVEMFGSGTDEDPFLVSCESHLIDITTDIEDGDELKCNAVYRQIADIDMDYASFRCDNNFGWIPIGTAANPFRGKYIGASTDGTVHTISDISMDSAL